MLHFEITHDETKYLSLSCEKKLYWFFSEDLIQELR